MNDTATTSPTVSVVMPVYNAEGTLRRAIDSVLEQTLQDFELIVVDDGSTDGSADIVKSYADDRIRLIRQTNQGCYPARNRGLSEARGGYLANMDADDVGLPERLEKQVAYLEAHEEVVLVGTKTLGSDDEDTFRLPQPTTFTYDTDCGIPHVVRSSDLNSGPGFTCATILFRRDLLEDSGGYDERLCYSSDIEFVARATSIGRVGCLPQPLYVFRIAPDGISSGGSMIQRDIIGMIRAASEREKATGDRSFTSAEVRHLEELERRRRDLPKAGNRIRRAFYETRVATLLRVNGRYRESMKHAIRAATHAPEHLLTDRKLVATMVKSGFGLRPSR